MEPGTTDWRAVALVVAGGVTAAMHVGKAAIALPALGSAAAPGGGLGADEAAWLLALPGLVGCASAVVIGTQVRRFDTRTVFVGALAGSAGAAAAGAWAGSPAWLLGARALEAMCGIVVMVAAPVLLAAVVAAGDHLVVLGVWGAYMPLGQTLVVLGGGGIVHAQGWPALWLVTALASLCTAVAAARLRVRGPAWAADGPVLATTGRSGVASDGRARSLGAAESRGFALLGLVFLAYALQWVAITGYLPTLLTDLGVGLTVAGVLTAVVLLGNVAGNAVAGVLGRRGVPGSTLLVGALTAMLLAGSLVFAPGLPVAARVLAALVFSTCGGVVPGTLFGLAAAPGTAPGAVPVGRRHALLVQGSQLGAALGPVLVAWTVAAGGGWHAAAGLMAVTGLGALALCTVWSRSADASLAATTRHFNHH